MFNIEKYGNFKSIGKQKNKTQIILCHTGREVNEYLASLSFRYNKKYDKIPNFIVTRDGNVIQLLPNNTHSNFFNDPKLNANSVVISLENLGWLEKKPLSNEYINWKGSIYKQEVYEKKWRDFFFWHPYTKQQIDITANLCSQITEDLKIKKKFIGHNTKVEGVNRFEGIICRSNFDTMFTDLNPSFDFENFTKKIENEQFAQ